MSDQPRPLPGQPSLRYLKLEARRRLAAGEFGTLHDAQLAVAREHGQPSWTALKQLIESRLDTLGHPALEHLRWVISRFSGADGPGWAAPADEELRLAAEDRIRLDDAANDHLRTVRLANDAITVRELLSYTSGVDNPALGRGSADTVPCLTSLYGPVLPCSGSRGTFKPVGHGDYAALGQLIADVTGSEYAAAVTRLVLGPLAMTGSTFPVCWPHDDPDAITGYELEPDGTFLPDLDDVAAIPASAGLWTTAADLVAFGTGWSSLLPAGLAAEVLRPQAGEAANGLGQAGFGWLLTPARGLALRNGDGPGGSASLVVRPGDNHVYVALANRRVQIASLNARVLRRSA